MMELSIFFFRFRASIQFRQKLRIQQNHLACSSASGSYESLNAFTLCFLLCLKYKICGKFEFVKDIQDLFILPLCFPWHTNIHVHTSSYFHCLYRLPQPLSLVPRLSFHWKVSNYDSCQRFLSTASFATSQGTLSVTHRPFSTGVECYYLRGIRGWKGIFSDRAKQLITQLTPNNLPCAEMNC